MGSAGGRDLCSLVARGRSVTSLTKPITAAACGTRLGSSGTAHSLRVVSDGAHLLCCVRSSVTSGPVRLVSVSVGIGYEIDSILTSGLSSVKLSIMTDSHHLRHRGHHSGDWDRVLSVLGNVVCRHVTGQPPTTHTLLVLVPSSGTTGTAWLSDAGSCGSCAQGRRKSALRSAMQAPRQHQESRLLCILVLIHL